MTLDPSTLPGALALWKFDEGSGRIARNAFASSSHPGNNLVYFPEQHFNRWTSAGTGVTTTNGAGNNPNGVATASRCQFAAGLSYIYLQYLNSAAGQYTLSVYLKNNGASDRNMRLAIQDATDGITFSSPFAVTVASGWQRYTFTRTTPGQVTAVYIVNDGTNAADMLVWGAQFEYGGSATDYQLADLDLILPAGSVAYTWTTEGLTSTSSNSIAPIGLQNSPQSISALTMYAVVKRTAEVGFGFAVSEVSNFQRASLTTGTDKRGGWGASGNYYDTCSLVDSQYHVLSMSWDGTNAYFYVDGTPFGKVAASTGWTTQGFALGYPGFPLEGYHGPTAVYDAAHTASEHRQMVEYLRGLMTGRGVTMTAPTAWVQFEGDSITAADGFPETAMEDITPLWQWGKSATAGAQVSTMEARAALVDERLLPSKRNPVLWVLCGRNDLQAVSAETFFASLKSYCQDRQAEGWLVVLATLLPSTFSGFNTKRNTVNSSIVADATFYDVLCRFDQVANMGADSDASNATYYSDGTHPTAAGNNLLAPVAQAAIEEALAISAATGGVGFGFFGPGRGFN